MSELVKEYERFGHIVEAQGAFADGLEKKCGRLEREITLFLKAVLPETPQERKHFRKLKNALGR